jgi:hypothetical protein
MVAVPAQAAKVPAKKTDTTTTTTTTKKSSSSGTGKKIRK